MWRERERERQTERERERERICACMYMHVPDKPIIKGKKESNVLFNNALDTFYLTIIWCWTSGKGPQKWSKRKPAATMRMATLFISSKLQRIFYRHHPTDRTACTSHGNLVGIKNSTMGPPWRKYLTINRTMNRHSTIIKGHLAPIIKGHLAPIIKGHQKIFNSCY